MLLLTVLPRFPVTNVCGVIADRLSDQFTLLYDEYFKVIQEWITSFNKVRLGTRMAHGNYDTNPVDIEGWNGQNVVGGTAILMDGDII